MVCFLSQSFCGGLRGCEKLQQNAMETRHGIPLTFKRVRLQAGRCVVTRGAAKQLDGSVDGMKTHFKNLGDAN